MSGARAAVLARSLIIPAILLEGDPAPKPHVSGRGQRYDLTPTPPPVADTAARLLSAAIGTGQLHLVARDAHSLYAHWNLSREQQCSVEGSQRLGLRIFQNSTASPVFQQAEVKAEATHCFVPVPEARTAYVAELGQHGPGQQWAPITTSLVTQTPSEEPAPNSAVCFATIPLDQPISLPPKEAPARSPAAARCRNGSSPGHGEEQSPALGTAESSPSDWLPEQERALAKIIEQDLARCRQSGSSEIAELIRRKAPETKPPMQATSGALANIVGLANPAVSSADAPFGEAGRPRGFWLNVNAELIIYGATMPDATVAIGGRAVDLRPDGTFSIRFALPDGIFELPVTAASTDGWDQRRVELGFSRVTLYEGQMETQPPSAPSPPPF